MKTIQQDLKSSDQIDVYVWRYALLVVLARNDDDDDESPAAAKEIFVNLSPLSLDWFSLVNFLHGVNMSLLHWS